MKCDTTLIAPSAEYAILFAFVQRWNSTEAEASNPERENKRSPVQTMEEQNARVLAYDDDVDTNKTKPYANLFTKFVLWFERSHSRASDEKILVPNYICMLWERERTVIFV